MGKPLRDLILSDPRFQASMPRNVITGREGAARVDIPQFKEDITKTKERFGTSAEGKNELLRAKNTSNQYRRALEGARAAERLAERSGADVSKLAQPTAKDWDKKTRFEKLVHVLQSTERLGANAAGASIFDDVKLDPGEALSLDSKSMTGDQLSDRLEKRENPTAAALDTVLSGFQKFGEWFAKPLNPGGTGYTDNINNPPWARTPEQLRSYTEQAGKGARRLAVSLAVDPTTYIGGGTKGAASTATKQAMRVAKRSGLTGPAVSSVGREVAQAIAEIGGTPQFIKRMEDIKKTWGLDQKALDDVLGKNFELAGQSGMQLGFGARASVELPSVFKKEQLGRRASNLVKERALKPAHAKLVELTKSSSPDLVEGGLHAVTGLQKAATKARTATEQNTLARFQEYKDNVASLMPKDKAAREALVERYMRDGLNGNYTQQELRALAALDNFVEKVRVDLYRSGLIKSRQVRPQGTMLSMPSVGRPTSSPAVKLGAAKSQKSFDPDELVANFIPQAEKARAAKDFDVYIADNFGKPAAQAGSDMHTMLKNSQGVDVAVPNEAYVGLSRLHDDAFKTFKLEFLNKLMNVYKQVNTLPTPRYHLKNMGGDLLLMHAAGMGTTEMVASMGNTLKVKGWQAANPSDVLFKVPGSGLNMTVAQARKELEEIGALAPKNMPGYSGTAGQFDLDAGISRKKLLGEMQSTRETWRDLPAKINRNKGELAMDVASLGMLRGGKKLAAGWDELSKTMYYLHRRSLGDSSALAMRRLYEVLPDYGARGPVLNAARKVMPFATWNVSMARNLPKHLVRNPAAATRADKLGRSFETEDELFQDEAPNYIREKSASLNLPAPFRNAVHDVTGRHKGYGVQATIPDPVADAAAWWHSFPQSFKEGLGPHWQAAMEGFTNTDPLTGQRINIEWGRPLPQGTVSKIDPRLAQFEAQASGRQPEVPWLTRWTGTMLSPAVRLLINKAAQEVGLNPQLLGRPRRPGLGDSERLMEQALNAVSPFRLTPSSPMQRHTNVTDNQSFDYAAQMKPELKNQIRRMILQMMQEQAGKPE